jgi:hypothetical protein
MLYFLCFTKRGNFFQVAAVLRQMVEFKLMCRRRCVEQVCNLVFAFYKNVFLLLFIKRHGLTGFMFYKKIVVLFLFIKRSSLEDVLNWV